VNDNLDTPEALDRQLEAARKALQDFEDNIDWGRLMQRLRTASPAHPLLLFRLFLGFGGTLCVVVAIIVLITTLLSEDIARTLARFETVIPLPEQVPALPTVLAVAAAFLGFSWLMATGAALAIARDAPMLPWEQKQHQKLFNEVTRLTTQKAVMERIKNTPAGARPRIATPVPVANRRTTPGQTPTAPGAGLRAQPSRGAIPTPAAQSKSATPTPVSRTATGGFGARNAIPPTKRPGQTPKIPTPTPPRPDAGAKTKPMPIGGAKLPGALPKRTVSEDEETTRPAPDSAEATRRPSIRPATTKPEVARRDSFASPRPLPSVPRDGSSPPRPPIPTPRAAPAVEPETPRIAPRSTLPSPTETPTTPVTPAPTAAPRGWADQLESARPPADRADDADATPVSAGLASAAKSPLPAVMEAMVDWDDSSDTAILPGPMDDAEVEAAVVLDVEAPPPTTRTPVSAGPRPAIVMPTMPPPAPATNGAHVEGGGVRLGALDQGGRSAPVDEDQETEADDSIEPSRPPDGILGRVRTGALGAARPTPYGSAGRVRLPPPAATVRLGAVDAAMGQSTRGGTPLGAPPKAGVPVGQAKPRNPTPVGVQRTFGPRPTSVAPASPSVAFPSTPDPSDRVESDAASSIFATPAPFVREAGPPPSALATLPRAGISADDLDSPTVVPTRKSLSDPPAPPVRPAPKPVEPRTQLASPATAERTLPSLVSSAEPWMAEAVMLAQSLQRSFPAQAEIRLSARDDVPFSLRLSRASPAMAVRAMVNFVEFLATIPTPPMALIELDSASSLDRSFQKNVEAALEPYFKGAVAVVGTETEIELRFAAPDVRWSTWRRLPIL
jgi:hypothetical protein